MKNLLLIFECKGTISSANTQIFSPFFCYKNFNSGKIVLNTLLNAPENRKRMQILSKKRQKSAETKKNMNKLLQVSISIATFAKRCETCDCK